MTKNLIPVACYLEGILENVEDTLLIVDFISGKISEKEAVTKFINRDNVYQYLIRESRLTGRNTYYKLIEELRCYYPGKNKQGENHG